MNYDDVSVNPHGKLELTLPEDAAHPDDALLNVKSHVHERSDPAIMQEALMDRSLQQEAEQAIIAEAQEHASSAEPAESGALTVEQPRTE